MLMVLSLGEIKLQFVFLRGSYVGVSSNFFSCTFRGQFYKKVFSLLVDEH